MILNLLFFLCFSVNKRLQNHHFDFSKGVIDNPNLLNRKFAENPLSFLLNKKKLINQNHLRQQTYVTYMNNDISSISKRIAMINITNLRIINDFIKNGYEILSNYDNFTPYILSSSEIVAENFNFHSVENLIPYPNTSVQIFHYNYTNKFTPRQTLYFFRTFLVPTFIFILISSVIVRFIPLSFKSKNPNDFSIIIFSKEGHILTPVPNSLPISIIFQIRKDIYDIDKNESSHNFFTNGNSLLYKIIYIHINNNMIMCVVFRLPFNVNTFACHSIATGTVMYTGDSEKRYQIDSMLSFSENNTPSINMSFKAEGQPCNVKITCLDPNNFALGRQCYEIERFITIQENILYEGLKSKPSRVTFIRLVQSAYRRLNYTAVVVMIYDQHEIRILAKFIDSPILEKELQRVINNFSEAHFIDGETEKWNVDKYRIDMHSITVENSKYIFFISADGASNIIRSIELNFHAVLTMLVTHNHAHLISRGSYEDLDVLKNVWGKQNFVVFECVNKKVDWLIGNLFGKPVENDILNCIYSRIIEPLDDELNKVVSFMVPIWKKPGERNILLVNGINTFDSIRNVKVLTCTMRDVTNYYNICNEQTLSSVLGAIMIGFNRVFHKDLNIDFPEVFKRFFNEQVPKSFSQLTKITETKILQHFSSDKIPIIRLIKANGKQMNAATCPIGDEGDFVFFPQISLMKTIPKLTLSIFFTPKPESSNDTRVTFLDLLRDTYLDLKVPTRTSPYSNWEVPNEIAFSPKCRKHIEIIAGSFYRKHCPIFLNSVIDSIKTGKSIAICSIHEIDTIRPYLVDIQYSNGIMTIVMISLEYENRLSNQSSMVKHALDGVNPTGHIFEWTYLTEETVDGIYATTPGGVEPQQFSKNSLKLVIVPEQRMMVEKQLDEGYINLPLIVKFDEPRWYISKGKKVSKGVINGVCILVPMNAIPNELQPGKKAQSARYLNDAFNKLQKSIDFDKEEFNAALDIVTVVAV